MQGNSRAAAGRRRAAVAKRAVAFAAAGCFAAVLVLARATHPGATATGSTLSTLSAPSALLAQVEAGSSLSGGTIAPAASAPSVSTSTS